MILVHTKPSNFNEYPTDMQNEQIYLKVTYVLTNLTNLMFLYYNWLYVIIYVKTAHILPIVLAAPRLEAEKVDVNKLMIEATRKVVRINYAWNGLCLVWAIMGVVIALTWHEEQVFAGVVLQDSIFTLCCMWFVAWFEWSLVKIRRELRYSKEGKHYVNVKLMRRQLILFVLFFISYLL